jgi:hypothetical protein
MTCSLRFIIDLENDERDALFDKECQWQRCEIVDRWIEDNRFFYTFDFLLTDFPFPIQVSMGWVPLYKMYCFENKHFISSTRGIRWVIEELKAQYEMLSLGATEDTLEF